MLRDSLFWTYSVVGLTTLLVSVGRFTVPGHGLSWAGTYEAFAHIWVGAMLLVCFCPKFTKETRILCGVALLAATVLETVMFILR